MKIDKISTNDFIKERYMTCKHKAITNIAKYYAIDKDHKNDLILEMNIEILKNGDLIKQLLRRIKLLFVDMGYIINIDSRQLPKLAKSIVKCSTHIKKYYSLIL